MNHLYLLVFLFLATSVQAQISDFIHVDQFGYLPDAEKVAVISNPINGFNSAASYEPGDMLEVIRASDDQVAFTGSPTIWNNGNTQSQSGDQGWWFDFSALTSTGTYYIFDPETGDRSAPFEISENPYAEILKSSIRAFYYNRCNAPKSAPTAATGWTDETNFLNANQDANCRYVYDQGNSSLEKDLSGGWFDAGDYNKYVTFAQQAVHQLLSVYEEHPTLFGDDWDWPESGNGLPDLLDEIKWELDWMYKMTNSNGTVHIKMGSINFSHNASAPPSANFDPRYYGPTCTSASAAAASVFAHASLVFADQPGMSGFAETLESRAITCWNYFVTQLNDNALETNCDDGTINAGDADDDANTQIESALIAAVYLFHLTGEEVYHDFFRDYYSTIEPISVDYWAPYKMHYNEALLYYTTLPNNDAGTSQDILSSAATVVSNNNSSFFAFTGDDLYRAEAPDWMYHWGSNNPKANLGNLCHLFIKYNVASGFSQSLARRAAEQLHYFHGVNPLGIVYLSNMYGYGGDRCADEIYHTWFNDGSDWDDALNSAIGPAPGFLVGGPNASFSVGSISPPAGQPQQKSYLDFNDGFPDNSWEITEPSISYQASYVRFLANFVNLQMTTDLTNIQAENTCIEIFPNPTGDHFYLKGHLSNYDIGIYSAAGELVNNVAALGSLAVVDISALASGTFFVRIENKSNSNLCVQKMIKQ